MNKIYLRKTDKQCIEKQTSIKKEILKDFFGADENKNSCVTVRSIKNGNEVQMELMPATDPRISGATLKQLLNNEEVKWEIGDILYFERQEKLSSNTIFEFKVIKKQDDEYSAFNALFIDPRHALITSEVNYKDNETPNDNELERQYTFKIINKKENINVKDLSNSLKEYLEKYTPKPCGIYLFAIAFIDFLVDDSINKKELLKYADISESYLTELNKGIGLAKNLLKNKQINNIDYPIEDKVGKNVIYYGIPGVGKSYHIENRVLKNVNKRDNVFRTTFYLDYANSDFVGQILPYVDGDKVSYKYMPGPFTKALARALTCPNEHIYLVVEELNRGNAAAIFGDIFQLLDRKYGESEYPISNAFIENYFKQENKKGKNIIFTEGNIIIPSNMSILASMNTSDQNVFPLDTAFKRRWETERIIPKWDTNPTLADKLIPCTDITWKEFATVVNNKMDEESFEGMTLEDKQLGPWFVNESMFVDKQKDDNGEYTQEAIKSLTRFVDKVIDYIYNDVAKFNRTDWFEGVSSFNSLRSHIFEYAKRDYKLEKNFMIKDVSFENKKENDDEGE